MFMPNFLLDSKATLFCSHIFFLRVRWDGFVRSHKRLVAIRMIYQADNCQRLLRKKERKKSKVAIFAKCSFWKNVWATFWAKFLGLYYGKRQTIGMFLNHGRCWDTTKYATQLLLKMIFVCLAFVRALSVRAFLIHHKSRQKN